MRSLKHHRSRVIRPQPIHRYLLTKYWRSIGYGGVMLTLYCLTIVSLSDDNIPKWILWMETLWVGSLVYEHTIIGCVHKRARLLHWGITVLISILGTLTLAWGVTLGEVVIFLTRDSGSLRSLGLLIGLGFSIGIGMATSAVIQLLAAICTWSHKRFFTSKNTSSITPHNSIVKHRISMDHVLDEVNFQIWSITRNTVRGLGWSLLFIFGLLTANGLGVIVAIAWMVVMMINVVVPSDFFNRRP